MLVILSMQSNGVCVKADMLQTATAALPRPGRVPLSFHSVCSVGHEPESDPTIQANAGR